MPLCAKILNETNYKLTIVYPRQKGIGCTSNSRKLNVNKYILRNRTENLVTQKLFFSPIIYIIVASLIKSGTDKGITNLLVILAYYIIIQGSVKHSHPR